MLKTIQAHGAQAWMEYDADNFKLTLQIDKKTGIFHYKTRNAVDGYLEYGIEYFDQVRDFLDKPCEVEWRAMQGKSSFMSLN